MLLCMFMWSTKCSLPIKPLWHTSQEYRYSLKWTLFMWDFSALALANEAEHISQTSLGLPSDPAAACTMPEWCALSPRSVRWNAAVFLYPLRALTLCLADTSPPGPACQPGRAGRGGEVSRPWLLLHKPSENWKNATWVSLDVTSPTDQLPSPIQKHEIPYCVYIPTNMTHTKAGQSSTPLVESHLMTILEDYIDSDCALLVYYISSIQLCTVVDDITSWQLMDCTDSWLCILTEFIDSGLYYLWLHQLMIVYY